MRVLTADSSEVVTNGAGVKLTPGTARARVWDATTGKLLLALDPREHGIWCVCFSPDGRRLVTGGGLRVDQNTADATVVVWDAESGGELARLPGHGGGAWQMAFTPDGSRLIVTCARGPTKIWDAETGTDLIALEASDGMANSLVYDAVSTRILIAHDQTLVAWDAAPVNRAFLRFPVAPPPRTK
jgi:WD40 repeat protein